MRPQGESAFVSSSLRAFIVGVCTRSGPTQVLSGTCPCPCTCNAAVAESGADAAVDCGGGGGGLCEGRSGTPFGRGAIGGDGGIQDEYGRRMRP